MQPVPGDQLAKRSEVVNAAIEAAERNRGGLGSGFSVRLKPPFFFYTAAKQSRCLLPRFVSLTKHLKQGG